ncbi:hypothetical protein F442_07180 [Phytophthora nicotianae P10297]|uniref:Uncharacterized protein n=1 Tax=Phytophthora nicotianae P10297 TaxID=1317064 RepID=W2ZGU0_PHYNI|nr:hypothetical protein F442_07180 [Phytophthora nicotianae P10297]
MISSGNNLQVMAPADAVVALENKRAGPGATSEFLPAGVSTVLDCSAKALLKGIVPTAHWEGHEVSASRFWSHWSDKPTMTFEPARKPPNENS